MSQPKLSKEGFIEFRGHKVWYGIAGDAEQAGKAPVLTVHGGPGMPHDCLESFATLVDTGRRVVFYDQLGCGNSDRPKDASIYTPGLLVEELAAIRSELGLDRVHLFGHSYGGPLVLNYVLDTKPTGLVSLTLSDSFASVPDLVDGWHSLRARLLPDVLAKLKAHEDAGTTSSAEYNGLLGQHFIAKHVCTVAPSEGLMRSQQKMGGEVYAALHGPQWFKATGQYGKFDVKHRLGEIDVPTLLVAGHNDQCVPALSEALHRGIKDSELTLMEGVSHLPFLEAPDRFFKLLDDFFTRTEQRARG